VRTLRYLLAWYFFGLGILTAAPSLVFVKSVFKGGDSLRLAIYLGMEIAMIAAAFAFGKAWWVLKHEKLPAKLWCIAASATSLIVPVMFLIFYALDPRHKDFWQSVGLVSFYMVPIAIGIGGILLGLSDAANPHAVTLPHLGLPILISAFLLLSVVRFVRTLVVCVFGFIEHRRLPASYFVDLAVCGFIILVGIWFVRRELRQRGTRLSEIAMS
jgi:hypothetical protein